jgi:peroxiredoxin
MNNNGNRGPGRRYVNPSGALGGARPGQPGGYRRGQSDGRPSNRNGVYPGNRPGRHGPQAPFYAAPAAASATTGRTPLFIALAVGAVIAVIVIAFLAAGSPSNDNDPDGDGVPNDIENQYGSDIYQIDTDHDKLDDEQEIFILATNPTKADSDADGVSDFDEDTDEDTLTDGAELANGTNPLNSDTDFDELPDAEENMKTTNPLLADTDSDGAKDGWEVLNLFDPLTPNETFTVKKSASIGALNATISTELSGELIDSLSIQPTMLFDTVLTSGIPGMIGEAFELNADAPASGATLSIQFEPSLLQDSQVEPAIFYFNEDTQLLEELPTEISGNTASAELTHFSSYLLKLPEPEPILHADVIQDDGSDIDSNGDGITDNYLRLLIDGTLRTGTGQTILEGGNFDFLNADTDWDDDDILNGEEIKITSHDMNGGQKKVYVIMVSNPLLWDSDGDSFGDYDELYTTKTDPNRHNELFYTESVDEVLTKSNFYSTIYYGKYKGQPSNFPSSRYFDETIAINFYAHVFNLVELSKDELKDYLKQIISDDKDYVETYQWNGLCRELMDCFELSENLTGVISDVAYDSVNKQWHQIGGFARQNNKVAENATRELYQKAKSNPLIKKLFANGQGNLRFSHLNKAVAYAGGVLSVADLLDGAITDVTRAIEIETNLALYQQQIDLLELIKIHADDDNVKVAAKDLIIEFQNEYYVKIKELESILAKSFDKSLSIGVLVLAQCLPAGGLISAATIVSNILFSTGEDGLLKHRLYTIGTIGDILADEFSDNYSPLNGVQVSKDDTDYPFVYPVYRGDDEDGKALLRYSRLRHAWLIGENAALAYSEGNPFRNEDEEAARKEVESLTSDTFVDPRLSIGTIYERETETPDPTVLPDDIEAIPEGLEIGQRAPDFTLNLRGGGTVTLSQLRGKPVLLNFCTTWCPPCQVEFPEIQKTYDKYGDQIHVLGVSSAEEVDTVDAYFDQYPELVYPLAYDPDNEVSTVYNIEFIPQTWVLDANGVIVDYIEGSNEESRFSQGLDAALGA